MSREDDMPPSVEPATPFEVPESEHSVAAWIAWKERYDAESREWERQFRIIADLAKLWGLKQ